MAGQIATQEQEAAWWDVIGKFKAAVADFDNAMSAMRANQAVAAKDAKLLAEYRAIEQRAADIQKTIQKVKDGTQGVVSWLKGVVGMDGLGSLGVVPLIPIAVVSASVFGIAKVTADAWQFAKRLSEVRRLEGQGLSPSQAAAVVNQAAPSRALFQLDTKWIVLGALGAIGVWWFLIRKN